MKFTNPQPTPERLRELFDADSALGLLIRKSTGKPVGTVEHAGYLVAKVDGGVWRVHRMLWAMAYGAWPAGEIDHLNGDRQDNRLSNLRDVPKSLNAQNLRQAKRSSKTGVLGVSPDYERGGYKAQIVVDGRNRLIGRFGSVEEASAAYVEAKRATHEGCTL